MKWRAALVSLAIPWLCASSASALEEVPFRFLEQPGPHRVGLNVVEIYDHSRTYRPGTDALGKPFPGERARPLQLLVWYPSSRSGAKPMTVGSYLDLWATQTTFGPPQPPALAKEWREGMSQTLSSPLWAVRDAPAAEGRFPLVVYAASLSRPSWENADLCEYLASHGYVVIGVPSMGVTTRGMTTDVAGANAQAQDISFAITHARSLANVDMSMVAVVGCSWGGLSNVFAAARDSRIDALVALDGSVRYYPGVVKQAGDVHPEQMTIPLLYFAQGEFSFEDQERYLRGRLADGPNVLNAWTHGDLVLVRALGLTHQGFSAMSQRNELDWSDIFPVWKKADFGRAEAMTGYAWVARYTLWFLDAYLKHDAAAAKRLEATPADNGVPRHFLAVSHQPATGVAASLEGFRAEVGRRGFDRAAGIYAEFQTFQPAFTLDEVPLVSWAEELIARRHMSEAVAVLQLNVHIHPQSAGAHASLGDAYVEQDRRDLAIESYRRALECDAHNAVVAGKLARLTR